MGETNLISDVECYKELARRQSIRLADAKTLIYKVVFSAFPAVPKDTVSDKGTDDLIKVGQRALRSLVVRAEEAEKSAEELWRKIDTISAQLLESRRQTADANRLYLAAYTLIGELTAANRTPSNN